MKIRFIYNPRSGRNARRSRLAPAIREFIASRLLDAELSVTEGPGHATLLAREAAITGCARVVAVGGDGTVNEIAQALLDTPVALAFVPCGSGNGLALHLHVPRSPLAALELLTGAPARVAALDTGVADGRPFFNAMGLGLDAEVSRRFNALTTRGLPAYARTALAAWRDRRPECVTISGPGWREKQEVLLVAIANSDQYGNHARIAPGARVDDGQLDLVAVQPVGLLRAVGIAARLFLGNIDGSVDVQRWRAPHFLIRRNAPGLIHTDGETHHAGASFEVKVRPASLRVLIPAGSPAVTAYASEPLRAGFALPLP